MKKVWLGVVSVVIMAFLGTGCLTKSLWETKGNYETYQEKDTIRSFMMTQDQKTVVFLGDHYHYVFNNYEQVQQLLSQRTDPNIKFLFDQGNYQILNETQISVAFPVSVDNNASASMQAWAKEERFVAQNNGTWKRTFYLGGTRYLADANVTQKGAMLSKPLELTFEGKRQANVTAAQTVGKILMTPVAIAGDGALVLGGVAILVIAAPFALLSSIGH